MRLLPKRLYREWKATTAPAAQIPQAPWNLHIRSIQPETDTKHNIYNNLQKRLKSSEGQNDIFLTQV